MSKTELFVRKQAGGMFSVVDESLTTGDIWWVDSGSTTGADAAGYGQNPDGPFLTLDYAIGACTANNGDIIFLMPGHAETKSAAGSLWAADVAGVKIVGLGAGAARPTFTFGDVAAVTTISAASVWLENVILAPSVDSVVAPLTISAADVTLKNIEIRDSTAVECVLGIITTTAAHNLHIDGLYYNGDIAGNACTLGVSLVGVDNALIENCRFDGVFSVACINLATTHCHNIIVRDCIFNNVGTALTKNVVDTITGSTWAVVSCYDLIGGYSFSGSSGAALASDDAGAIAAAVAVVDGLHDVPTANAVTNLYIRDVVGIKTDAANAGAVADTKSLMAYAKQNVTNTEAHTVTLAAHTTSFTALPKCVEKANGEILASADPIFTVTGGPVLCQIYGMVSTAVVGTSTCRLSHLPTAPAVAVELNFGAVAIDNAAIGTMFYNIGITSVFTLVAEGALIVEPVTLDHCWFLLTPGGVRATCSDARVGNIRWFMLYRPLSPSSVVTAAA